MKELISPSFIILSSIYGIISGYLAYRRKKNPYFWFLIGFFFGLIGIAFFLIPQKKDNRKSAQRRQVMILQGPIDKMWFYLDSSMQQVGPISYNALLSAFKEGKITKNSYTWHENLSEWKKLEDFMIFPKGTN